MMAGFAVIFDMDGTLVDNNPYHLKAWQKFYADRGRTLTDDDYLQTISGFPNKAVVRNFFGGEISLDDLQHAIDEKENTYRELYRPYVQPIAGLMPFLQQLHDGDIRTAIATSAMKTNIDFVMNALDLWKHFDAVIDTSMVSAGKPDPEIFLKAAATLGYAPEQCVVFEDSLAGIQAANAAGMKVVAITTAHTESELQPHQLCIRDYTELSPASLAALF